MKKLLIMFLLAGLTYGQALTGLAPSATYKDLLHISNSNLGLDATLRPVYDGAGNASALQISTTAVKFPTPFTLGAVSVTTTGTQLNYLSGATGTTGTTTSNLVFSASPVLVTPTLGVAAATSLALGGATIGTNALAIMGTTQFGTSAWPINSYTQTGNRILITGASEAFLLLNNANNTIAAGNGSNIYLGARSTTNVNDATYALITGAKENSTSGDFSSYFQINTVGPGGSEVSAMRINSSGNVGIGYTSDPTSGNKLFVNGNGYFNGSLTTTSSITSAGLSTIDSLKTTRLKAISTGTAPIAGEAVLVSGTVTVNTTAVRANSVIVLTRKASGGATGTITYTIVSGTSFTINSDNILDTSTFRWAIINPY